MSKSRAVALATSGWFVFPARPDAKKSYLSAEFSGGAAWGMSNDPATVAANFDSRPDARVGLPTGAVNRIVVIDLDTKDGKNGPAALAALEAQHGALPATMTAKTPSGGLHLIFAHPGGHVPNSVCKLGDGVDVRGDGGMIIAYETDRAAIAPLPTAWVDLVTRDAAPELKTGLARHEDWTTESVASLIDFETRRGTFNDYDSWLRLGMACALLGDAGWDLWARSHDDTVTDDVAIAKWNSFDVAPGPNSVTLISFTGPAKKAGWTGELKRTTGSMFDSAIAQLAASPNLAPGMTPAPSRLTAERRINAATLAGKPVPEREWLVPNWIPAAQVTLLYGDGGTGKSLLALQLATAVASGTLWLGHLVTPGPVEFITAEDSAGELHRRLHDIAREIPTQSLAALGRLHITSFADEDAIMASLTGNDLTETPLYHDILSIVQATHPRLLILDTLADVFAGNEIIRAQARAFVNMLRRIALASDSLAIVVLAHPSAAGINNNTGTSGSTAWSNSVRSRLYLTRPPGEQDDPGDPDARTLTAMKLNYGKVGTQIEMRWRRGVFVTEEQPAAGADPLARLERAKAVFLELLDRTNAQNIYVCAHPKANNFAPKIFAMDGVRRGVRKSELREAMNRLIDANIIHNAPHGPVSRTVYRLERTHMVPESERAAPL